MKIGFNARLLYDASLRGWSRYTINLLAELAKLGLDLVLYTDRHLHNDHLSRLPDGSYAVRVAPSMPYVVWEQSWLPRQCAVDAVDILHTPFNFGLPWFSPCPRVLTLHDAIDQIYYQPQLSRRQKLIPRFLQTRFYHWLARHRAHHIITVSQHAKDDLVARLKIPEEKIAIIYEAHDPRFQTPVSDIRRFQVRYQYQLHKRYAFYVGGWEQRKNISFLIQGFSKANLHDVELVLAGGTKNQHAELIHFTQSLGITSQVRLLDWVEDCDLPALYAEALCFVYPSVYEGFGLQLCESMATGCPTLAANSSSLPEVLASGGATFPIDDPQGLSNLLVRVATDVTFRRDLQTRAQKRSADFSWQRTARQTYCIYNALVRRSL